MRRIALPAYSLCLAVLALTMLAPASHAGRTEETFTGTVIDKETRKPVPSAAIHLKMVDGDMTSKGKSDENGAFRIEGVTTDTKSSRTYCYDITVTAQSYKQEVFKKVCIAYNSDQDFKKDLRLEREVLEPPAIESPKGQVLSLRPTVECAVPKKYRGDLTLLELELAADNAFAQQDRVYARRFEAPALTADGKFAHKLEASLKDSSQYFLRLRLRTKDGLQSVWAGGEFTIPNAQEINSPLPEKALTDGAAVNTAPSWMSTDRGEVVVYASNRDSDKGGFQIRIAHPGSSAVTQLTTSIQGSSDDYPVMFPGKDHIIFASNRVGGTFNLWSVPVKGAPPMKQITVFAAGHARYPSVSRDGSRIAFARTPPGTDEDSSKITDWIWTISSDGSNLTQLCRGTKPKLSPNGRHILYVNDSSGNRDIWRIAVDGTENTQVTSSSHNEDDPDWLDSRRILYTSDRSENQDVWLLNLRDGKQIPLTNSLADDRMPAASSDGKRVAFVSDRGEGTNIYWMDLDSFLKKLKQDEGQTPE